MKKILSIFSFLVLSLSFFATPTFAAPVAHLNTGPDLNASVCNQSGAPIVNVTYKIVNDYDSGFGGNAWANDTLNRSLKIYDQGSGSYCAVVRDAGQFVTFAGMSPLDTSVTIPAGITGTIQGGYIGTFTATAFDPQLQVKGNLGTKDYACTDAYTCPGAFDWPGMYFSGFSNFNQPYWAWNYQAGTDGSMVQASSGYQGNILGN